MNSIILATGNQHKIKEFGSIFENKINFKSLNDINFNKKIIENGSTFIANSLIKCSEVYNEIKLPVMADDSGLCVEALDGQPGVYSARYGGADYNDKDRYLYLLENLKGKSDLRASFVCALVLYINPNRIYIIQEEIKGEITFNFAGNRGFGYDPVFFLKDYGKTMAQLTDEEKNGISHRGKAAKEMLALIKNLHLI